MVSISFLTIQLITVGLWLLFRGIACLRKKGIDWKFEALQLIFLINLLVVVRFTFHPFSKVDGQVQPLIFDIATAWPFRINLVPFVNLLDYDSRRDLLLNIIGNFAMFIPSGIVLPLIYKNLDRFEKVFLAGFFLSLAIEVIQLPFAVRASDVDDLILNTLGCATGYGIVALVRWVGRKCLNRRA